LIQAQLDLDDDHEEGDRMDNEIKALKEKRSVTFEQIQSYEGMLNDFLRKHVVKNWNEASVSKHKGDISLGNSGWTMDDFRQYLRTEICVAIQNYNPEYRTEDGKSVKESTFVFNHLFNRIGQLMKRLTKKHYGYGVWTQNLEEALYEHNSED
jgi:hypothetical protein